MARTTTLTMSNLQQDSSPKCPSSIQQAYWKQKLFEQRYKEAENDAIRKGNVGLLGLPIISDEVREAIIRDINNEHSKTS